MKTTQEQRDELRRLAVSHSVLKWPELIDLLDDFEELERTLTVHDGMLMKATEHLLRVFGEEE